jgi:hypothetical protein
VLVFIQEKLTALRNILWQNAGAFFENSKKGRGSISEDIEQPLGGSENMRLSLALQEMSVRSWVKQN